MSSFSPFLLAIASSLAPLASAQGPRVDAIANYMDRSVGAVLVRAESARLPFHLDVADRKALLWLHAKYRDKEGAQKVPVGTEKEREVYAALRSWANDRFPEDQRKVYYSVESLSARRDPVTGEKMEWNRYLEAQLLRALRRYTMRTRATIERAKTRPGKGLMLKIDFDEERYGRVIVRDHDGDPRLFVDDSTRPLPIGSTKEVEILAIVDAWLLRVADAATHSRLAAGKNTQDLDPTLVAVHDTFRYYRDQSYPRLVDLGVRRDGGSVTFRLVTASSASTSCMFDRAIGTKTPGRLKRGVGRGHELLGFGTPTEERILRDLETWIARAKRKKKATDTRALKILEPLVKSYHEMRKTAFEKRD